ncbi:thioredoxin-disulfide reductase [Mesoplasma syrphidae]|uniref:Thioredoxin reductase n=1 Tax=Mesoplasma syrphidae TaxID=225999 RepID=A0A2K9CA01_9MOLU|nr:thioredoxin-disulfide reductase [Mesoplasma syrphidae]AUF83835.1 thioredoxin-disulfide reductase [Mesoplasma syrphidae]
MKNHTNKEVIDVLIIGGGPAGMTAAVYTSRAGLNTVIVEKEAPGGKMIKTEMIENFPGHEAIMGPDLSIKMYAHATSFGTSFEFNEVVHVKKISEGLFEIHLLNEKILYAKTVILATGTKENELGVPGEQRLYGKGVSYCAVCDGAFHKGKDVAVVGGGYSAVQEGMYLKKFVDTLYVIVRKDHFRTDIVAVEKLRSMSNVKFLMESVVEEIIGETKVEAIKVKDLVTGKTQELKVSAIFPYIGATPITQFVSDLKITDESGYVLANPKMRTSIEGLYVAGDVRDVPLRQIAIAVGDGAMAGQMAVEYLQNLR